MARRGWVGILAAALVALAGCTSVEKGATLGGALGSGLGAVAGHATASLGSGPGALIGLGLGAAGGAIAAHHYYGPDETGELAERDARIEQLSKDLQAKDAELASLRADLAREKSQQKALLQAYDMARAVPPSGSPDIQVQAGTGADAGTVKVTILSEVLFASGKATLTSEGKAVLKQAAQILRTQYPGAQIEVRGHTDNEPIRYSNWKSNQELSEARAKAVKDYLVAYEGFRADQIATVGYGESRPVASNDTAEGRRRNRRAELVVKLLDAQVAGLGAWK